MDYDALTATQKRLYHDGVSRTHHRAVELRILTLDGAPVTSLTNAFIGGSVQGDTARTPCEVFEADVLDEDFALDWTNGAHRHYKVRIVDSRFIVDLDDWVDDIVFTGPLWDFERKGPVVSLVAHGSELLAMGSVRRVFTRKRKAKATDVITDLLKAAGAQSSDLSIPNLAARLPVRVTVGVRRGKKKEKDDKRKPPKKRLFRATLEDTYWPEADRIADAIDRDLFTDGRGRFNLRSRVSRPAFDFTPQTLLSPVTERRPDSGEVPNTWLVLGADPKGPKKRIEAEVSLPTGHPLSAQKLGWNGTPRQIIERIENKHLRTGRQARDVGERRRDQAMREMIEYEIEALPVVPRFRPLSLVSAPSSAGKVSVRVKQWTLPLGPGADALVIGANRSRMWTRATGRHHHGGHHGGHGGRHGGAG